MFDHVKRIHNWTTMACHIYEPNFYSLMTIPICEMKGEDVDSQLLLWNGIKKCLVDRGIPIPDMKFITDNAMANWHAVRQFYGQASTEPLDGRERACGLHLRQSLLDQTKKHITPAFREAHVRMCTTWFDSKTVEEAEVQFAIIRGWWTSSGAADPSHHKELHNWLGWWHFRYPHLGRYIREVSSIFFMVYLPFHICPTIAST